MRYLLFASIVLFTIGCNDDKEAVAPDLAIEGQIFELVNDHRTASGLPTLERNTACDREASSHSGDMATGNVEFGHDGWEGRFERITEETGSSAFGENVAFGQEDATSVMNSWLDSSPHKANIEGDFSHIGIGVAEAENGQLYFTQVFVKI